MLLTVIPNIVLIAFLSIALLATKNTTIDIPNVGMASAAAMKKVTTKYALIALGNIYRACFYKN